MSLNGTVKPLVSEKGFPMKKVTNVLFVLSLGVFSMHSLLAEHAGESAAQASTAASIAQARAACAPQEKALRAEAVSHGVKESALEPGMAELNTGLFQLSKKEMDDLLAEARANRVDDPTGLYNVCFMTARLKQLQSASPTAAPKAPPATTVPSAPKVHNAAAEASNCVHPVGLQKNSLYGGLENSCAFKVNVAFCNVGSKAGSSSAALDCDLSKGGLSSIPANSWTTLHTKDAQRVEWAACKDPAYPKDAKYVLGRGITHRCE